MENHRGRSRSSGSVRSCFSVHCHAGGTDADKGLSAGPYYGIFDPATYADTEAYQQLNSVIAIGSGQLWGKGLNNTDIASVKNGNFLPESQTDFIFAVIGEELGFVGSAVVILLLILIAMRCVSIARVAKDTAGMVIAAGMGSLIGIQGFMNIAVATMMMPNTGLPLPFVSYGLSSLVSMYIGIGFVLNVGLQRKNLYNL